MPEKIKKFTQDIFRRSDVFQKYYWKNVSVSTDFIAMIDGFDRLYTMGKNSHGQLGRGAVSEKETLARVGEDEDWAAVFASPSFLFALKYDGSLWACGNNAEGSLGLGQGTPSMVSDLTRVGDGTWRTVRSYESTEGGRVAYTFGISTSGELFVWGRDVFGMAGQAGAVSWAPAATGRSFADCRGVNNFAVAMTGAGDLWVIGSNEFGQLGMGSTGGSFGAWTRNTGVSGVKKIAVGQRFCALVKEDSTLWVAGSNLKGELGTPGLPSSPTFIQVPGRWEDVEAGNAQVLGIKLPDPALAAPEIALVERYMPVQKPTGLAAEIFEAPTTGVVFELHGLSDDGITRYSFVIGEGASRMEVALIGGLNTSGDADLYVRHEIPPGSGWGDFDCASWNWGNDELCVFDDPEAGEWHVMIEAWNPYVDVSLVVTLY
jgi:alpha-tubulin suppressor-like RCC1 family protein